MSSHDVKFIIESIDEENSSLIVRHINPYGVIATNKKTLEDFKEVILQPTGDFYSNGSPVTTEITVYAENPNGDIILNYDLQTNANNQLMTKQEMLNFIAEQNPDFMFQNIEARKQHDMTEYKSIVGQEILINISDSIPEPIPDPIPEANTEINVTVYFQQPEIL